MHKVNVIRLGIDNFVTDHCSVYPRGNIGRAKRWAVAVCLDAALLGAAYVVSASASPLPGGSAAQYAQTILARPLFTQNRRPPPQAHHAGSAPDEALPRLSGIIVAAAYRRAIFDGNGHPAAYREGDHIGRYTILAIGTQNVTLAGPDGTQAIGLSFDANRPNLSTPAPPSAPSILEQLNSHIPYRPPMPRMPTPEEFQARMEQRLQPAPQ